MFHPITTRKWVLLVRDLAAGPMAFTQKTATCARVVCWCSSPGASGAEDASRRRVCSVTLTLTTYQHPQTGVIWWNMFSSSRPIDSC